MTTMTTPGQFTLHSQNLGCLPIVNFFLNRIGLADHLRNYLPHDDARLRLAPAAVRHQPRARAPRGRRVPPTHRARRPDGGRPRGCVPPPRPLTELIR